MAAGPRHTRSQAYPVAPGVTLTVNQTFAGTKLHRAGTDVDVETLDRLFNVMNYKVVKVADCPWNAFEDCIANAVSMFNSSTHYGPFFLCILTHGTDEGLLFPNGCFMPMSVSVRRILSVLRSFPALYGKPKILLIQACRGDAHMADRRDGPIILRDEDFRTDNIQGTADPDGDTLIFRSSLWGRASYRSPTYGTRFIGVLSRTMLDRLSPEKPMNFQDVTVAVNHEMSQKVRYMGEQVFATSEVQHSLRSPLLLPVPMDKLQELKLARARVLSLVRRLLAAAKGTEIGRDEPAPSAHAAGPSSPAGPSQAAASSKACSCGTGCGPKSSCGCRRGNVPCGPMCHKPKGSSCENSASNSAMGLLDSQLQSLTIHDDPNPQVASQPSAAAAAAAAAAAPAAPRVANLRAPDTDGGDVVCNCTRGCETDRCGCQKNGMSCTTDCHRGDDCSNIANCGCKTGCVTNKCSCVRDGWLCDENCHPKSPCCKNLRKGRKKRLLK